MVLLRHSVCIWVIHCEFLPLAEDVEMFASPGLRVLCVDDNRDAAVSLAELFELVGFDSRFACDGESGLREALDFRPDVCVLDINMPGLDGCELADRLRQAFGRNVVLIAVTGVANWQQCQRIAAAGFDMRLTKPADPDVLIQLLAAAERRKGIDRHTRPEAPALRHPAERRPADDSPRHVPRRPTDAADPSALRHFRPIH
jgi:CheY-like chemotaxis protein